VRAIVGPLSLELGRAGAIPAPLSPARRQGKNERPNEIEGNPMRIVSDILSLKW
jgi:hypothetical protein